MKKNTQVIRNAHPSDLPYLYDICLKTGLNGKDATSVYSDPYMLGQYYVAPYFFFEPELCFVVDAIENSEISEPAQTGDAAKTARIAEPTQTGYAAKTERSSELAQTAVAFKSAKTEGISEPAQTAVAFKSAKTERSSEINRPLGYIVATSDSNKFQFWLKNNWMPRLQELYGKKYCPMNEYERNLHHTIFNGREEITSSWYSQYPAHLHIDLLPQLQGQGCGRKLMETLWNALSKKNIPGVHLGVSASNESAISFYEKMNFSILEKHDWGYKLGHKL